ncbi:hypothetical protein Y032_0007g3374 [Ancylostoma ceylanicum]|uniref:STAS domain-containing protein n=1 Tax=Ancylostoma ceylanicum TaxID=53326 RepID=A0A016VNU1_9BILA|nr:hypothetical protein Y032_0007g3374 [Ancylostoma ceylanicum]
MDSISLLGPPQQPKVLNQDDFDSRFNFVRHRKRRTNREILRRMIVENFRDYRNVNDALPFLAWIRNYDVKASCLRDFLGSLLLAALLIPQGIANGFLAMDVFSGMFSILLPHLIYPFLGSARHCSLGSLSMTSFLIYSSVKYTGSSISTVTLCCGVFQLLHFFLPLDFLLSFVSSNLLLGFSTGVAFRIIWHLVPSIFEFSSEECNYFTRQWNFICFQCAGSAVSCVQSLNIRPPLIFFTVLIVLLIFKWKLNAVLTSRIGTTIPHELLVMILLAIISYFADFPESESLVSYLESRTFMFSPPSLPSIQTLLDSYAIFLFSLCAHIKVVSSAEKVQKSKTKQKFFCFSLISLIGSPFGLLPPFSGRDGSQVCNEARNFSLLSNLLSTIWMAPLLYFGQSTVIRLIPQSAVIALIIASISDFWTDLRHLRVLFLSHVCDAVISTCALLAAVIIPNLCVAFLVSVACALLSISLRTHWPDCEVLVRVADNYFAEEKRYEGECPDSPLRIVRLSSPLIFINCETVRRAIQEQAVAVKKLIGIGIGSRTPSIRSHVQAGPRESLVARSSNNLTNIIITTQDSDIQQIPSSESAALRFIILDCSGVAYVDPEAVAMLTQEYSGFGRRAAATLAVVHIDRGRGVAGVGRRRRRCRRQQRPTIAAVVDNGDRPSPLSSTTATDRRRCRRQQRPTVAAVVDTPSSIPIDDSDDDRGDRGRFFALK